MPYHWVQVKAVDHAIAKLTCQRRPSNAAAASYTISYANTSGVNTAVHKQLRLADTDTDFA